MLFVLSAEGFFYLKGGEKPMFNNLRLHTELFTPLSVALMVVGAILVYGAKFILRTIYKKDPSVKQLLIVKTTGLIIFLIAIYIIFTR
jgi:hypothetical protein